MTLRSLLNGTANASMRLYERVGRATSNGRGRRHNRRGMALVVVMAVIVILSVSVVEFIYNTRVNLHLAQNHRDEVKAYFLARSGINLQRLAVGYQFELANQPLVGDAMTRSGFQLWRYTEYLLPTFSTGSIDAGLFGSVDLEAAGAEGFGGIMGDIEFAPVVAEEGKININAFASRQLGLEEVQTLCALLSPPIHDDLLSSEQQQLAESRFEVIAAIIDHVDPDTDLTVLDADCQPSVGGAGNESSRYIDMDWGPKDAALVTLGELLTVPGVNDAFMDRFADNLTVYPVPNKLYINLADAQQIAALLCTNIEGAQVTGFSPCNDQQWASTYGWQVNLLSLAMEGYINYFTNIYTVLGGAVGAG
ncbi:MAG: general secretion pathway protein K, partial [Flavobacteriales bacterium]